MQRQGAAATSIDSTVATRSGPTRRSLALGLTAASGFAALGYEIVWTQQTAVWLGHESVAVLAVLAAFFGGLALGALTLGSRIDRSAVPAHWYAGCEAVIGSWSLALLVLMTPVTQWLLHLIGPQPSPTWHWLVAFAGIFILLLPATVAMGATMPAMESALATMRGRGSDIAALYAGNTLGAVAGVLCAAFWLVPAYGLARSSGVLAALNLLCALGTLSIFTASSARSSRPAAPDRRARTFTGSPRARRDSAACLGLLAATGFLGIGYEVLVVRVLAQVTENTVYTFALLLSVYLLGTASGAAAYGRSQSRNDAYPLVLDRLLRALAAMCLIGIGILAGSEALTAGVAHALGRGMAAALATEAAIAVLAFLPPTFVMGALFCHVSSKALVHGTSFGRALGINTLGAAFAPPVFGVVVLPACGPKIGLLLIVAGYLALSSRSAWSTWTQRTMAAATLMLAAILPPLAIVDVPEGGRIVSYREGVMATVSVVEDANGVASLHINNRQQEGSSATVLADSRQALLPMLLHPTPRRALFLGLGTGVTASAAAMDPALQVDAVELLPEVIEASAYFTHARGSDTRLPGVHVVAADARRFVRADRGAYDLIIADNFHPARSGSGSLYTVEHFIAVRDRLSSSGLFCQWLPLHQLDLETLRSIVRTFLAVYPHGWAILATNSLDTPVLGLVAMNGGDRFDLGQARRRLSEVATPRRPAHFGIVDEVALLGSFVAGPRSLSRFAADAPLNTDDHPVVAYRAPRNAYAADSSPADRLIALLHEVGIGADEILADPADVGAASRLSAYWRARNRFIEAGRDVRPTADVRRMLAQVREPLLTVLRISPDFRGAYDPLLRMAIALGDVDVGAARALLTELQDVQPARPEAAQALRGLGGASQ